MGSVKGSLNKDKEKKVELNQFEFNYLKILTRALETSIFKDQIIAGYLHILCYAKYGIPQDTNLAFEIDMSSESRELTIKIVDPPTLEPEA